MDCQTKGERIPLVIKMWMRNLIFQPMNTNCDWNEDADPQLLARCDAQDDDDPPLISRVCSGDCGVEDAEPNRRRTYTVRVRTMLLRTNE